MRKSASLLSEVCVLILACWLSVPASEAKSDPLEKFSPVAEGQTQQEKANRLTIEADQAFEKSNYKEAETKYAEALTTYEAIRDPAGVAACWYKLAKVYRMTRRYDAAAELLEKALKQHDELGDQKATSVDLNELAQVERSRGNYNKSITLSEQALKIIEELGDKKTIARALINLAVAYRNTGQFKKAIAYSERGLKIAETLGDKAALALAFNTMGNAQNGMGNFAVALECYQKSLQLSEELGDKIGIIARANNMGILHGSLANFKEALEYLHKALRLREEINDRPGIADSFNNIGIVHSRLGNYREALEYYQKALKIGREMGGVKNEYQVLVNIATTYALQARYSEALEYYHMVIKTTEKMGDRVAVAQCLANMGGVNYEIGNYMEALSYNRKALQIREEINDRGGLVESLTIIGAVHNTLGNHAEALDHYQKALKIVEQTKDKSKLASVLGNIGATQESLGNYAEALNYSQRALKLCEEIGEKRGIAANLRSNGFLYYRMKEMPAAEKALSEAIQISRQMGEPENLWISLYRKGLVFQDLGKTDDAVDLMKDAIQVIEQVRGQIQLTEDKISYLREKVEVYNHLIQLLVYKDNNRDAFHYAERAKSRAFLDLLAEAKSEIRKNISPELLQREKMSLARLLSLQNRFQEAVSKEKLATASDGSGNIDRGRSQENHKTELLKEQLTNAEQEYEVLKLEIRRGSPEYAALQYPEPITLQQAQRLLGDRDVLLEYVFGPERSLLFAVTTTDFSVYLLPARDSLEKRIEAFNKLVGQPPTMGRVARYRSDGYRLYELLVKPAEKQLAGKRSIIVVPDGAVALLPFQALLTQKASTIRGTGFKNLPYLLSRYDVRYIQSASVLANVYQKTGPKTWEKKLVAFAPITFDENLPKAEAGSAEAFWGREIYRGGVSLGNLPYTKKEVESLRDLYGEQETTLFMEDAATEEKVKDSDLRRYRYVHFATHGIVNVDKPEFSAIILRNEGREDGRLQLAEIFNLAVDAEVVTLSACQTGQGKHMNGEGLIGMARGFMYAGASAVLASLWNVQDKSAAYLMKEFYKSLADSTPSKALRKAQLAFIQSAKNDRAYQSYPYYWSVFVLVGER